MGGIQGSQKFKGLSAYSSSKGAIITLTECLAEEFKTEKLISQSRFVLTHYTTAISYCVLF